MRCVSDCYEPFISDRWEPEAYTRCAPNLIPPSWVILPNYAATRYRQFEYPSLLKRTPAALEIVIYETDNTNHHDFWRSAVSLAPSVASLLACSIEVPQAVCGFSEGQAVLVLLGTMGHSRMERIQNKLASILQTSLHERESPLSFVRSLLSLSPVKWEIDIKRGKGRIQSILWPKNVCL
jgi:hypothetical protein